jgi:hypothetical protein
MADVSQIIQDAATANGVDPAVLARIAQVESGGDPNAAANGSSAKGLFQFTNPTWSQYGNGANPLDPAANANAGARLTRDNAAGLTGSGFEASPANIYLAHFSGLGGATKVLQADPGTPIAAILGDSAVAANPFLKGMTASDLQNWAARKMGGTTQTSAPRPTTGILNASSVPTPSGKPGMLNGGTPDATDEPDLTNVLAKALPPVEQQQVAALPPIRFVAPKGFDRAKFLAALTARKIA